MRAVFAILLMASAPLAAHATAQRGDMKMPAPDATSKAFIARSAPADGAMMLGSPTVFTVTFTQPIVLTAVTLTDDTETEVAVTAKPVQKDATSAEIALPTLEPSTYRLTWTGTAAGKPVTGTLSFMVH